jgi:hypothetical protein
MNHRDCQVILKRVKKLHQGRFYCSRGYPPFEPEAKRRIKIEAKKRSNVASFCYSFNSPKVNILVSDKLNCLSSFTGPLYPFKRWKLGS